MKLELSKNFYKEITQKIQQNKNIIEKRYKNEGVSEETFEGLLDTLIDDHFEQEELEYLAGMLVISHNYSTLEHFLKMVVGNLLKEKKTYKNKNYKKLNIGEIVSFFTERGIDIVNIKEYKECNILRLLVNSIKHNGARVSKELAKAKSSYKEKDDIKVLPDEVNKYSDAIKSFCYSLVSLEINKIEVQA